MKLVLIILALAASVVARSVSETDEEEYQPLYDCIEKSSVSEEDLANMAFSDYRNVKSVRDFLLCGAVKSGIFTSGKGFDIEKIKVPDCTASAVKNCANQNNSVNKADDQAVYDFVVCLESCSED